MERLNLRSPKTFDYSDEAGTIPWKIRFYCVAEGATEESYFEIVRNNRMRLHIKNYVSIEVIPKEEGQETLSHPLQLVNACLYSMGRIDVNGNPISEDEWQKNCKWKDFEPETDEVCVIFDRDYKRLENELDHIFALCKRNGIRIVMSNPNFELWLLMHFPGIGRYDRGMLLENKKNLRHQLFDDASTKKKYLEILVAKNANGYSKGSKLKEERFLPYIDIAVEQAGLFCENSEELVKELGTAIGRLIRDMRA